MGIPGSVPADTRLWNGRRHGGAWCGVGVVPWRGVARVEVGGHPRTKRKKEGSEHNSDPSLLTVFRTRGWGYSDVSPAGDKWYRIRIPRVQKPERFASGTASDLQPPCSDLQPPSMIRLEPQSYGPVGILTARSSTSRCRRAALSPHSIASADRFRPSGDAGCDPACGCPSRCRGSSRAPRSRARQG